MIRNDSRNVRYCYLTEVCMITNAIRSILYLTQVICWEQERVNTNMQSWREREFGFFVCFVFMVITTAKYAFNKYPMLRKWIYLYLIIDEILRHKLFYYNPQPLAFHYIFPVVQVLVPKSPWKCVISDVSIVELFDTGDVQTPLWWFQKVPVRWCPYTAS